MQKTILVTLDGPSLEALIFDAVDRAIKINHSISTHDTNPYGDFKWLVTTCTGVPSSTLRIKSAAGEIPGVVKFGKRVLYDKQAVLNWLKEQTRQLVSNDAELDRIAERQINRQLAKKGGELA